MIPIEKIREIKAFYRSNASLPHQKRKDCITSMNAAIRLLYGRPDMQLGDRIDRSMMHLIAQGLAGDGQVIEFRDSQGKVTTGVKEPFRLSKSVFDTAVEMSGGPGWHLFGMSIMDGYHAVMLALNTETWEIYWCDQWISNYFGYEFSGWTCFGRETLDDVIEKATNTWWNNEKNPKRKPRTRLTLLKIYLPLQA